MSKMFFVEKIFIDFSFDFYKNFCKWKIVGGQLIE
jgi:hypothetical protein